MAEGKTNAAKNDWYHSMSKYKFGILIVCFLFPWLHIKAGEEQLRNWYAQADYFRLRDALKTNGSELSIDVRLYYEAITENAFNRNTQAIQKADSFLKLKAAGWSDIDIVQILEVKMDSYAKLYQYKKAANICGKILDDYGQALNANERSSIENSYNIYSPLANIPPQTVEQTADALIRMHSNMYGLLEVPVSFGRQEETFLFDTGANMSVLTESYAEKLGVKKLNTSFKVSASQGKIVESDLGVADSLNMGGIVIRNVVFIIMPDAKLDFPKAGFRIRGILGFPVISALKEVHIFKDSLLQIPIKPKAANLNNMVLRGLFPIVQAQTANDTMIFQFDTGATQTDFYSPFYEKYKDAVLANGTKMRKVFGGAGGNRTIKVYELRNIKMRIGSNEFVLPAVNVIPEPLREGRQDFTYGNLGHDVVAQFREMIINFDSMYLDFN